MQTKLHRWAAADPGRRFDDLFNFVHDPATLIMAFGRVTSNLGARTAGVDGLTVTDVERITGVPGFLDDLRTRLKAGTFRPLTVRERTIPKPGGYLYIVAVLHKSLAIRERERKRNDWTQKDPSSIAPLSTRLKSRESNYHGHGQCREGQDDQGDYAGRR